MEDDYKFFEDKAEYWRQKSQALEKHCAELELKIKAYQEVIDRAFPFFGFGASSGRHHPGNS